MYRVGAYTPTEPYSLWYPCHRCVPAPQIPMRPSASPEWVRSPPGAAVPVGSVQGCSCRRSAARGSLGARPGWQGTAGSRRGITPVPGRPERAGARRRPGGAPLGAAVPSGGEAPGGVRSPHRCPHHPRPRRAADPLRSLPRCPRSAATALGADLDGLPVVHFHHVKIKTVNPFPGRDKSAPLRVEVAADIH